MGLWCDWCDDISGLEGPYYLKDGVWVPTNNPQCPEKPYSNVRPI